MVANHFRWDFIGLSTDEKPTASTSEKVADGSTYYCSDNSKLYVWYKDQWYEKEARVYASGLYSVAIGNQAKTDNHSRAVALGNASNANNDNSVALGTNAVTSRNGEVNIGAGTSGRGYNSTNYRVIGGVHDGQDAHDATTVGQVNTRLGGLTLLSITQTAYDALTTKDANTLYIITGA